MQPPGADRVLVRHGDIGTKSDQVRRSMEGRLADNIRAMLADRDVEGRVERERTRLFVHTGAVEAATAAVTDTFGVASASPVRRVDPTLPAIREALAETARACHDAGEATTPFAVDARRAGDADAHDFASTDIEREGGEAVWAALESAGVSPEVDLDDPALTLFAECRAEDAYLFLAKRSGPGGMPVGTQRPVVALVSGGIDSPVAAWQLLRRGCPVRPVYVDLGEYGGSDHRARAVATVERLARYAPHADLDVRVVDGGPAVADLLAETEATRMLSLRRFMLAAAEAVAESVGAVGVVTGEAIGQKSSQTSANVAVTDRAVDLPVHRPLVAMDKPEITERARAIGTFDDSTIPAGCNRVAPSFPATDADLEDVLAAEPPDLLERGRAAGRAATSVPVAPDGGGD